MSGNKVNGTKQHLTPANFQGETLQVFLFFQGQYLGYQCFIQDRVTVGGSPNLDLYLPNSSPDEGHWTFQLAGGTLIAWFTPFEQDGQAEHKPQRRAVEPLDVFQLGGYRIQAKLLQASGFVGQYTGVESEPAKPARVEPADPGDTDPVKQQDLELEKVHREVWGSPADDSAVREGQASSPAGPIGISAAENLDTQNEDRPETSRTETEPLEETFEAREKEPTNPTPEGQELASQEAPAAEARQPNKDRPEQLQGSAEVLAVQPQQEEPGDSESASPARTEEEFGLGEEPPDTDADEQEPEEEEEEEEHIRYFSLIKEIFRTGRQGPRVTDPARSALEVVRFRAGDVQEAAYLGQNGSYAIRKGWPRRLSKEQGGPPPNFKLVSLHKGGVAEFHIREGIAGRFYSDRGSRDIWDLLDERSGKKDGFTEAAKRHTSHRILLPAGSWAVMGVEPFRYLVRYVPEKPKPPMEPVRPRVTKSHLKLFSSSMISHIVLLLIIGLTLPKGGLEGYAPKDQFAKVDPNILETLKSPEPQKPPKPLEAPVAKPKPLTPEKQRPVVIRPAETPKSQTQPQVPVEVSASARNQPAPVEKQVDVRQIGLLAALDLPGTASPGVNPKSQILLAAVTNLDAVSVPSDSNTFNLAGIAGKLATSEIQIPTGDVIRTVGAKELMKISNGSVGALASRSTGSGQIKAIVREPPKATISIRGGMSREAVLNVVNQHLDEIRDCYERELLHNPGLTGKIVMEWLIHPDGTVAYAKVTFTNIGHSSDLHLCVQGQVPTWKFPRPTDNQEVVVTFPFLFEYMGF